MKKYNLSYEIMGRKKLLKSLSWVELAHYLPKLVEVLAKPGEKLNSVNITKVTPHDLK